MTYLEQSDIANNQTMLARIAQAAAQEGQDDPDGWTWTYRRTWASAPGWDAAWASALASHPPSGDASEPLFDPGADEAVITDGMILSQVQAMLAPTMNPTEEPEGD